MVKFTVSKTRKASRVDEYNPFFTWWKALEADLYADGQKVATVYKRFGNDSWAVTDIDTSSDTSIYQLIEDAFYNRPQPILTHHTRLPEVPKRLNRYQEYLAICEKVKGK